MLPKLHFHLLHFVQGNALQAEVQDQLVPRRWQRGPRRGGAPALTLLSIVRIHTLTSLCSIVTGTRYSSNPLHPLLQFSEGLLIGFQDGRQVQLSVKFCRSSQLGQDSFYPAAQWIPGTAEEATRSGGPSLCCFGALLFLFLLRRRWILVGKRGYPSG